MNNYSNRSKFGIYRQSLEDACIETERSDSLVCPLCWHETPRHELTLEHFVPESIGGTETILTCRDCNNKHGSALDSHLAQFQNVVDGFQGHGTVDTELNVKGNRLVANVEWLDDRTNVKVVGKATNPSDWKAALNEFRSGEAFDFECRVLYRYSKSCFERAAVKAAYLIAFKYFGYEYAKQEILQVIRRRIVDSTITYPRLSSLIIEAKHFEPLVDVQHYFVQGHIKNIPLLFVIVRVRRTTTSYLGVFLPVPGERDSEFFDAMEVSETENNGKTLRFRRDKLFW